MIQSRSDLHDIIVLPLSENSAISFVQVKEVYDLLSLNYVEDDDASFRFQYSAEFLHWCVDTYIPCVYIFTRCAGH
jgi:hypothetical protein